MTFMKVSVTRTSGTDLYIEVPDDFDVAHFMRRENQKALGEIAAETASDWDWDNYGWQDTVEANSVTPVSKEEATQFVIGKWPAREVVT